MDLIADLELASTVEESVYTNIILIYTSPENNSIDRSIKLNHIVSQKGSDSIKAVIRLFEFISDTVIESRNYDESINELTEIVNKLSSENEKALSGWEKITSYINKLESYFIVKKIDDIKDRYCRVISFQITNDIRPIFDIKRESINSAIYPYILKIQTQDDKTFVCEFYDETIDKFIIELQSAKEKAVKIRSQYEGR